METTMTETLTAATLLTRTLTVDRDALATRAEGDEGIPVSLSSALPVERWFGTEVLEHSEAAINMERAKRGLPLLWNHDTNVILGRVRGITLGDDGKTRGTLVFGRSAAAQEKRADVEDGVIEDISIGYRIDEWVEEKGAKGAPTTYRATKWTPMEVSLVPVPADHTVGVGRSAVVAPHPAVVEHTNAPDTGKEPTMAEDSKAAAPDAGPVVVKGGFDRSAEEGLIRSVGRTFGMEREAMDWLDKGLSLEQVRAEVERINVEKAKKEKPAGHLGLNEAETRRFNPASAIRRMADGEWHRAGSYEKEISDEVAKRMGKETAGLYIPLDIQVRASVTGQTAGTSSLGGASVQTTVLSLIELIRIRTAVAQTGATFLSGLRGNIQFPRQITANTFNWTGENPTAANTLGNLTLDTVTLSPKTGMVSTAFSRQLLVQSSEDAQAMVLNDIAAVVALGIDNAAINGTGSNSQPSGLRTRITATSLGTHGAVLDWDKVVALETGIANSNADIGTLAYLTNSRVRGKLKTTLKSTTAGAQYIWEGGNAPGSVNGYSAYVSNQVPSNLTKGTNTTVCSSVIFGRFSELLIGEWGGALEIILDPYTYAGQNMIAAHAIAMVDTNVRHTASFATYDDVLLS